MAPAGASVSVWLSLPTLKQFAPCPFLPGPGTPTDVTSQLLRSAQSNFNHFDSRTKPPSEDVSSDDSARFHSQLLLGWGTRACAD